MRALARLARESALSAWLHRQGFTIGAERLSSSPHQHSSTDTAVTDGVDPDEADPYARALVHAVQTLPDAELRERIISGIEYGTQLADELGRRAMFDVAVNRPDVVIGLTERESDLHRSFWLYAEHPELFELACASDFLDQHRGRLQQFDLGLQATPSREPQALRALADDIGAHFRQLRGSIGHCDVRLLERGPGLYVLTADVHDLPALLANGAEHRMPFGTSRLHLMLEYSQRTGVVRTLVPGRKRCHRRLASAFAHHLLGVSIDPDSLRTAVLDLSALRCGTQTLPALDGGFISLRLGRLTLMTPDGSLKIDATAMLDTHRVGVGELLRRKLPHDDPLGAGWIIAAATLVLHYPPAPGSARMPAVTVEITRGGQLNLHRFDAVMQAQLEGYLVDLGVLKAGQTLRAVRLPPEPADEVPTPDV